MKIFSYTGWMMGLGLACLAAASPATAQTLADYTAYPPFVGAALEPNVLILLDNSGSMNIQAYDSDSYYWNTDNGFDPAVTYYGYFNSDSNYSYRVNRFQEDPGGDWNGNFLNWLTMRRVDVAKKVLVGGKAVSRSGQGNPHTLVGHRPTRACCQTFRKQYTDNRFPYYTPYHNSSRYYHVRYGRFYVDTDWTFWNGTRASFQIRVKVNTEPSGVVQQIGDKVRWGLELFNTHQGGRIVRRVGSNLNSLIISIENMTPSTWTPLAEAYYEGVRYFQQTSPYYYPGDFVRNQTHDPYYYPQYKQKIRCCKSFTLLITDGESTQDRNIPSSLQDYDRDGRDARRFPSNGSDYLDDVALWSHTSDLRPDLEGKQTMTLYTVFAFGAGSQLLKDAARNGAFEDLNDDNRPGPNPREWDKDEDGVPDAYFEAQDGYALESSLLQALTDMLRRSASGTSVSVLSASSEGEGAVYQAFFYPSKFDGADESKWLGFLHGLFIDEDGNMHEDSNSNATLDDGDAIVRLAFDADTGETHVQKFSGDGNGPPDSTVPLDDLKPIWEAGKELAQRNPATRQIYTWVDENEDRTVSESEFRLFDNGSATLLKPYLRADTVLESQMIIDYIRGENMPGYRNRTVTVNGRREVWKLGDIVNSSPVTVGRPKEQYDLIYKDASYSAFYERYKNRRNVVYVGANDGMLHAFNAGFYDPESRSFDPGAGHTLGEELWAYIPYELLPHLKWLTLPEYTHVYYVDSKPKVTDARIFADDSDHPGGWGTVLITGMRFGGGGIDVTADYGAGDATRNFRSAYFALDVTNPDAPPRLLWSFTDSTLGFTTVYPTAARIADSGGSVRWTAILGSGPTDYEGGRTVSPLFENVGTTGYVYVLDLKTGSLLHKAGTDGNAVMSDPIAMDGDLDYGVDTIYIGNRLAGQGQGNLYRMVTGDKMDPGLWDLSLFFKASGPLTAAPAIAVDAFSNIWVYQGTGRYLSTMDASDTSVQYFYGVKDPCWIGGDNCPRQINEANLVDVTDGRVFGDETVSGILGAATFSSLLNEVRMKDGWIMALPDAGERILGKPVVMGGIVMFTSFTPDSGDLCAFQGSSKLYATYFETGTAFIKPVVGQQGNEVLRDVALGEGVPATVGIHLGSEEGVKGFVQQSTGAVTEVTAIPAFPMRSGTVSWQEKRR